MVEFVDRQSGRILQEVDPGGALSGLLRLSPRFPGAAYALRLPIGERQVQDFASTVGIDLRAAARPTNGFPSVAAAFRRRGRETSEPTTDPNALLAFAPGRLRIIPEIHDGELVAGEGRIRVRDLLGSPAAEEEYDQGLAIVIRLGLADVRWVTAPGRGTICHPRALPAMRGGSARQPVVRLTTSPSLGGPRIAIRLLTRAFGDVTLALVAGPFGAVEPAYRPGSIDAGCHLACLGGLSGLAVAFFERGRVTIDADLLDANRRGHEVLVSPATPVGSRSA